MKRALAFASALALALLVMGPAGADHPAAPDPDNKYNRNPWKWGDDHTAGNDWIDIWWLYNSSSGVSVPTGAFRTRIEEALNHWQSFRGASANTGIHPVNLVQKNPANFTPWVNSAPGNGASCLLSSSPPAGHRPFIGFAYDNIYDPEGNLMPVPAKVYTCWNDPGQSPSVFHSIIVFNKAYSFYTGTGTPSQGEYDVRGLATHGLAHALGWRCRPNELPCGDSTTGPHFDNPTLCDLTETVERWQTMCWQYPEWPGVAAGLRSLEAHDKSATKSGYWPDCLNDIPPCELT